MPRFNIPRVPKRFFGIELETDSGQVPTLSNHRGFGQHRDVTVLGWEFTSPKLKGSVGLRRLRDFMADGTGIRVSRRCGFHAHFETRVSNHNDPSYLTDPQLYAVIAAYIATQDRWFSLVASSRQRNNWCHTWPARFMGEFVDAGMAGRSFREGINFDRYHWLNISAYLEHGTFENRLHQGTWNFGKVRNWIRLNLRFIKAASRIQMGRTRRLSTFRERADMCMDYALAAPGSGARLPRALRVTA